MKKKIIRVVTVDMSLGLIKGQLSFLNKNYKVIGVASEGLNIEKIEKDENIPVVCVNMERRISPIKDIKSLYQLYILFRKEKPFIVHSITPKAGLLSMIAAYFAGVPHRIHTFTGLIFPTATGALQKLLIFTDRILCRFATKIFPEGQGVKKDLINYKITKKPLTVVGNGNVNGIDLKHYNPNSILDSSLQNLKANLKINETDFVFMFAGRLVKDKGINELIYAFEKINQIHKNTKLLLVGSYEHTLDPLSSDTLESIKINENIISTGWVNDVRPYLLISNILTFPSYREGFPNIVIQAGAMGLPAIVTDINGSNEIILEGENGTIIPSRDRDSLYNKMLETYNGKISFSPKTCRELIITRYDQEFVWNAILKEYQSLES